MRKISTAQFVKLLGRILSGLLVTLSLLFVADMSAQNSDDLPAHYLPDNSLRYDEFQAVHPDMPFEIIAALVNANVDIAFYSAVQTVENPEDIKALVNKNFALPADYEPSDLVASDGGRQVRAEASEHFLAMQAAAGEAGHGIYIWSGFRGYSNQVASYARFLDRGVAWADRRSARAGHSEHQTGLALDISHRRDLAGGQNADGFSQTGAFRWMTEHAHEYGFILRYQQGYIDLHGYIYEPWHWRYVGVDVATLMWEEEMVTFEEYYGRYLLPAVRENIANQHEQLMQDMHNGPCLFSCG